jgi:hypothetical protein
VDGWRDQQDGGNGERRAAKNHGGKLTSGMTLRGQDGEAVRGLQGILQI